MVKQCQFYFAGVAAEEGSFTLTPGIEPSAAQLVFTPSQAARLPQIGTLTLTDGYQTRQFGNCRISRLVTQTSTTGRLTEATILDRRWLWSSQHFAITGEYNRNDYRFRNTRTAQQLAALCATAMSELGYDVTRVPRTLYPIVEWDADNPAEELDSLCQQLGMVPTLTTFDRLAVYPFGVGSTPPSRDLRQMELAGAFEPPVIPRSLVFEGGATQIQHDLPLRPLGKEITGANRNQFVPIENLSYKPAGGWENEDPRSFLGVAAGDAREAAKRFVWKLYGVRDDFQLPIPPYTLANRSKSGALTVNQINQLNDYFKVKEGERWRVLPINGQQNIPYSQADAEVIGYFNLRGSIIRNNSGIGRLDDIPTVANNRDQLIAELPLASNSELRYTGSFTIDEDNGNVLFADPVYFVDVATPPANNEIKPAVIRLRTSFELRDRETAAPICQQFWQTPGSPLAANVAKMVKRSDVWYEYDTGGTNNEQDFTAAALVALSQELNTYRITSGSTQVYKGFVFDFSPDGIVRSVTFDVGNQGGITHVDFGMERPEAYLTLQEARNRRMLTFQRRKTAEINRKRARYGRK